MTLWRPVAINGKTYDLQHLHPFSLELSISDGPIEFACRIRVSFNSHCFTETLDKAVHTPDLHYQDGSEWRAFCLARYEHTKLIRPAIEAAKDQRVYFSNDRNFMIVETVTELGVRCPYPIFFDLRKSNQQGYKLAMFVVSAYPKSDLPAKNRLSPIQFSTLARKIVKGQNVFPA